MARARSGLGRGLDVLLSSAQGPDSGAVLEVPVERIVPNPRQPRQRIDPAALQELAESIRVHGLLQPLLVSRLPDDGSPLGGPYQLIAGERRWQAARLAGLTHVPVIVKEATPQGLLEMALVENIQRADLNPLEEAMAYHQLIEEFGLTQQQVADRVGKSRVTIANALRILNLPTDVLELLASGALTEGHARALLAAADPTQQQALARRVVAEGLSVRATEELARRASRRMPEERPSIDGVPEPYSEDLEAAFRRALGTKVELFRSRRGGRLVIHFYSEEELQRLYDLLVGDG
ncbi:MAG: stage 0 sporulation protein J [Chloroflexota bacterium]